MIRTYDDVITRIAERTVDNYKQLKRDKTQRRVSFVDLYGVEYLRQGDANHPATFYVSISPDFMYYERFALKLQIMPFVSSVQGVTISGLSIGDTSLTFSGSGGNSGAEILDGTSTIDIGGSGGSGSITPNPHTHPVSGSGSGGVNYGLNFITTTSTNWRIKIHDVDITAELREQQDGNWISGEGIYPSNRTEDIADFYDILDVACVLNELGETDKVEKLLTPEMKKIEIVSDQPFQVATMVYLKYSHMNR